MDKNRLTVETDGHVLMIGLNNPEKLNSFDIAMYHDLGRAYGELNRSPDLRCGVLFAHGDHFTAGLDLTQWASAFARGSFPDLPEDAVDPMGFDEDTRLRKPLVMAVRGICFTIGLELLLATDIRVAAKDARFCQLEIKRGIYPVGGGTVRLIQEVGWGNAMRYLLTGDEITGEEAFRMGLVQELTEPGDELDRAMAIAHTIAKQAPLGVAATLASARLARARGEGAALARLMPDLVAMMGSEDVQEGIRSFIERREAVFKGR
ncbi:MAG: crotonase/enoyl-CoA hydratase family protein [Desulfomonilaceae bacterium]|nr:crotonase/enoyl-CoA hydratase family protein [Desulfomonilaceae bacterium]